MCLHLFWVCALNAAGGSGSGLVNAEAGCIHLALAIQDHALFLNWMLVL